VDRFNPILPDWDYVARISKYFFKRILWQLAGLFNTNTRLLKFIKEKKLKTFFITDKMK